MRLKEEQKLAFFYPPLFGFMFISDTCHASFATCFPWTYLVFLVVWLLKNKISETKHLHFDSKN